MISLLFPLALLLSTAMASEPCNPSEIEAADRLIGVYKLGDATLTIEKNMCKFVDGDRESQFPNSYFYYFDLVANLKTTPETAVHPWQGGYKFGCYNAVGRVCNLNFPEIQFVNVFTQALVAVVKIRGFHNSPTLQVLPTPQEMIKLISDR